MRASTKKLLNDIRHRKLRTLLTILGIAIGILGLTAINIASDQLRASFEFLTDTTAQPDLTFTTSPTDAAFATLIQAQPNVRAVQAERTISTRWSIASGHVPIDITAFPDVGHVSMNRFELVEGQLPGPGQILLESSDRGIAQVQLGDTITVGTATLAQRITVSGFARTQGQESAVLTQRASGYMRQNDVEQLFHVQGFNRLLIQLNDYGQRTTTARQLAQIFDALHVLVLGSSIGHTNSLVAVSDGLFGTMRVLSIIAMLLSAFLLLGTITALVTEQMQVIGTMKAIGASQGQVVRHYLLLVTLYGIVGTLLGLGPGILGGWLLVNYISGLANLDIGPLTVSPLLVLESAAVGVGVPLLAAALPIYAGTRITVRQALSGYGLVSGPAGRAGTRALRLLSALPLTMQFGMSNVFRRRARAILTLLTLTMAGTAFLAVQETSNSFDTFLSQVFATYHFDMVVSLPTPQSYDAWNHLLKPIDGVATIEPISWVGVQTQWGSGLLTGVQADSRLYQKQLLRGRWFSSGDKNVTVISEDAAHKSGLNVGDSVSFHDSIHSGTWHIIGIARDYNAVGVNSFGVLLAPMEQVNAFQHLPSNFTRMMMLQSSRSGQTQINALATRVDSSLSTEGYLPSVTTAQQEIQSNENTYQVLYILLDVVTIVVALVGAIGLFNSLAMSVLERRREIGILRSMGATGGKIAQVFWSEGVALGLLSWLLALVLGIPAAYGFVLLLGHLLIPVPFSFNSVSLAWMLVFIVLIATCACVIPVLGATRVRIAQTLRYE